MDRFQARVEGRRFAAGLLVISVLAGMLLVVSARASEGEVSLGEIVVTATRVNDATKKMPASVTVIHKEEIASSGAGTIPDLLEKAAGIKVVSQGSGAKSFLDLRGMGGDNPFGKVLVLLDGVRINSVDMSSFNFLEIPLGEVEKIEVVRGAMASLYGDAAIAGVINIITKRREAGIFTDAAVAAGSYGTFSGRATVGYSCKTTSCRIGVEEAQSAGYRERAAASSRSVHAALSGEPSSRFSASGKVSFNRMEYAMPGALTKEEMAMDRRAYQPARPLYFTPAHDGDEASQEALRASFQTSYKLGEEKTFNVDLAYAQKETVSDMPSLSTYTTATHKTYTVMPRFSWGGMFVKVPHKTILGVDFYQEPFVLEKFADGKRGTRTAKADIYRQSTGWYLREEVQAIPEKLFFIAGFRQERAEIGAKQFLEASGSTLYDTQKRHDAEAFDLGVTFVTEAGLKVFLKHSRAYRLPFIDEQVYYYGFSSDQFLHDLEKEKSRSLELGVQWAPLASLALEANIFQTDMEDEIVYNEVSHLNENLDATRHQGAELFASYKWRNLLELRTKYSYHIANFRRGIYMGKELPLVPNHNFIIAADIALLPLGKLNIPLTVKLSPMYRFTGSAYLSGDRDNQAPKLGSYGVVDLLLSLNWKPAASGGGVFIGVENLLNTEYATFGVAATPYSPEVYYPMPGRTFKVGLNLPF